MMTIDEMKADTDVLTYIRTLNAEREDRARSEGSSFYLLIAESIADECANVYEYELRMAREIYSDLHKEERGVRPSLQGLDLEQLEARIDALY